MSVCVNVITQLSLCLILPIVSINQLLYKFCIKTAADQEQLKSGDVY